MRQEMMGFCFGSGISRTICKQSAPRSREITTPAPHCSLSCRLDALPATQQTASEHRRQSTTHDSEINKNPATIKKLLLLICSVKRWITTTTVTLRHKQHFKYISSYTTNQWNTLQRQQQNSAVENNTSTVKNVKTKYKNTTRYVSTKPTEWHNNDGS